MEEVFIDYVCPNCNGEGCRHCNHTGSIGKFTKYIPRKMRGNIEFGMRVRSTRENRCVSMRELAEYVGVSVARLSDIECGFEMPNKNELKKLKKWIQ